MEKKAILTAAGIIHPLTMNVSEDKTIIICNGRQYECLTSSADWRKDVSDAAVPTILKYEDDTEASMKSDEFLVMVQIFLKDEQGNPDGSIMGNCRMIYNPVQKNYTIIAGAHFDCVEMWIHIYASSDEFFLPGYHDMTVNSQILSAASEAGFPVKEGQHATNVMNELSKLPAVKAKMQKIYNKVPFALDTPIVVDDIEKFLQRMVHWLETLDEKCDTVGDRLSDNEYAAKMLRYVTEGCAHYNL